MIDFRYHVVSIVAVFLALAVGIVIGATSLRDDLVGSLNDQVRSQGRQLKSARQEVKDTGRIVGLQDQYAEAANPAVLRGQLSGRGVAIVALPGTDDEYVDTTRTSLRQAGATVTTTVRLDESWVSGSAADRDPVMRRSAADLGLDVGSVPASRLSGQVLVESVAHRGSTGQQDGAATQVLNRLKEEDLATADPVAPAQAAALVVLWPGVSDDGDNAATVKAWAEVITTVGLSSRPVVGASAGPVDGDVSRPDDLTTMLRRSPEVTGAMSTVDAGERPVGRAGVVLALRDEFAGTSGQYGLAADATTVVPPVATGR